MKIKQSVMAGIMVVAVGALNLGSAASNPKTADVSTQMVITVSSAQAHTEGRSESLQADDLTVMLGNNPAPVVRLERLAGDLGDMQLFVLLDDATRSTSLGIQLPELRTFLQSLPATTQVAVGYMRNGTFILAQAFTTDHQKAAGSLRLPAAIPGGNGSPYFALSDLVKHWPSKQSTHRRALLMLTDGVDRYYGTSTVDDPYVETAVHDALKQDVAVYSIYLRGAGLYGRAGWTTTTAQSRLIQVSEETGGYAYFQGFTDPVTISPFLKDFQNRIENQYQVTIDALNAKGVRPVKFRTTLPLKIQGPKQIYLR